MRWWIRGRHVDRTRRHRPDERRSCARHATASPSADTPGPLSATSPSGPASPTPVSCTTSAARNELLAEVLAQRDTEESEGVAKVDGLEALAPYLGTLLVRHQKTPS